MLPERLACLREAGRVLYEVSIRLPLKTQAPVRTDLSCTCLHTCTYPVIRTTQSTKLLPPFGSSSACVRGCSARRSPFPPPG